MTTLDEYGDCVVCGHPGLRRDAHAEWCERVTAYLRDIDERTCAACGHTFARAGNLALHHVSHPHHRRGTAIAARSEVSAVLVERAAFGVPAAQSTRTTTEERTPRSTSAEADRAGTGPVGLLAGTPTH